MDKEKASWVILIIDLLTAIINLIASLQNRDQESQRKEAPQTRGTFLLYPLYHGDYEYTKDSFHYFHHRFCSFVDRSGHRFIQVRRIHYDT